MKIVHVLPSTEKRASGPSQSVPALSRAVAGRGETSILAVTGPATGRSDGARVRAGAEAEEGDGDPDGAGLVVFPRAGFPARLARSPELRRWLRRSVASGDVDIVHNHGLWTMANVYPGWATRGLEVPLVVSPRGTFSDWALKRSFVRKRVMWHLAQKRAIETAALFHATCEAEYADIRRAGFRQPVAIVPNGVELPRAWLPAKGEGGRRTLLFLGRLHPVKGVDTLLRAWATLEAVYTDWDLRIVGPGEGSHGHRLERLAASLSLRRVRFCGPLHGAAKTSAYGSADLFVLPTHSENFGMVVAEALAAGCPVVTTRGAPWSGLTDHAAGWWIDIGLEPLRHCLKTALATPPATLGAMGRNGRDWMARDFSWDGVGARMVEAYRWIGSGDPPPSHVRVD